MDRAPRERGGAAARAEYAPRVPPLPEPPEAPPRLVETDEDLARVGDRLARARVIALDTEANSLYVYRERACVLQITADGESTIVDLFAVRSLEPVAGVTTRDHNVCVFHGGDFDIALLSREHGVEFRHVFDTMIAATILGEPKVGLADLVREAYGVELDKRFQTADWGRRPLSPEQIEYLHHDTLYLPGLYERLRARLEEADLCEEAEIEFERLAERRGTPVVFDPEGWRGLKGANRLDASGRAVLARLWCWRDAEAARLDRPPFKVIPPRAMVEIAQHGGPPPRKVDDLRALSPGHRRRFGREVLDAVRAGLEDMREGRGPAPEERERPSPEEKARRQQVRAREERLRAWRREEAGRRKVPNLVVLPNRALGWLVNEVPSRVEDLALCRDVGPKRAERYGETWLTLLAPPG